MKGQSKNLQVWLFLNHNCITVIFLIYLNNQTCSYVYISSCCISHLVFTTDNSSYLINETVRIYHGSASDPNKVQSLCMCSCQIRCKSVGMRVNGRKNTSLIYSSILFSPHLKLHIYSPSQQLFIFIRVFTHDWFNCAEKSLYTSHLHMGMRPESWGHTQGQQQTLINMFFLWSLSLMLDLR